MNGFGLTFDHFGLATRDVEKTLGFLEGLGYEIPESIYDPLQEVHLVLCTHDEMPAVEVIYGLENSPIEGILSQQPQSIYHLCYRSADLSSSLRAMKQAGYRALAVSPPKPAVLFAGKPVSFYMISGFGLIEIIEETS